MSRIHIQSVADPFTLPGIARQVVTTIGRAEAMGLLPKHKVIQRLDLKAFQRLLKKILEAGIARTVLADLKSVQGRNPERLPAILQELNDALTESPLPEYEWPAVEETLGMDLLARLLGISPSSIRRYRSGRRPTPDTVAARLHFLAMIVGELAGAYNDIGIRRWFDRKRTRLGDRSPAEILAKAWSPDDPGPAEIRELAHSLVSSPAT